MKRKTAALLAFAMALTMLSGCGNTENEKEKRPEDSSSSKETTTTTAETTTTAAETVTEPADTTAVSQDSSSAEVSIEDLLVTPEYDTAPVVEAYKAGDKSGLNETDAKIYDKASEILSEFSDDMSDYEKELAVHDWMITNVTYDAGSLKAIPQPSEHCEDPYGALVNGQAICMGYATTFQLFMGMLDIPCVLIHSVDYSNEEHAWNAVQLDGNWYYVDVTWDDPVPDEEGREIWHKYFNVTKEFIEKEHTLTEDSPESEVGDYTFSSREAVEVSSIDEIKAVAEQQIARGYSDVDLIFTDESIVEGKLKTYTMGNMSYTMCTDSEILAQFRDIDGKKYMPLTVDSIPTEKGTVYSFMLMKAGKLFG